jgi:TonB family protein
MKTVFLLISILLLTAPRTSANNLHEKQDEQSGECDFSQCKYVRIILYKTSAKKRAEPEYPPIAKEAKITGIVQVRVLVDKEGKVVRACATTGHPILKEAAVKAARKWRFSRNFGMRSKSKIAYIQEWILFDFKLAGNE